MQIQMFKVYQKKSRIVDYIYVGIMVSLCDYKKKASLFANVEHFSTEKFFIHVLLHVLANSFLTMTASAALAHLKNKKSSMVN